MKIIWPLKKNSKRKTWMFWFLSLDWNQSKLMKAIQYYIILTSWMLTQTSSLVPSSVQLINKWISMLQGWDAWISSYQAIQVSQHIMLRPLPEAYSQWYNIIHLFSKYSIWIRDISIKIWPVRQASFSPIFKCCYTSQKRNFTNLIVFKALYSPLSTNFGWIFRIFIFLSSIKGSLPSLNSLRMILNRIVSLFRWFRLPLELILTFMFDFIPFQHQFLAKF